MFPCRLSHHLTFIRKFRAHCDISSILHQSIPICKLTMRSILSSSRTVSSKVKVQQIINISSNEVKRFTRQFSSLGSPMFPHVHVPEVNGNLNAVPKGEEDFMTRWIDDALIQKLNIITDTRLSYLIKKKEESEVLLQICLLMFFLAFYRRNSVADNYQTSFDLSRSTKDTY